MKEDVHLFVYYLAIEFGFFDDASRRTGTKTCIFCLHERMVEFFSFDNIPLLGQRP
jgi:hypothetical protein